MVTEEEIDDRRPGPNAGETLVVGLSDRHPTVSAGDTFYGATVTDVDPRIDSVVVETEEPDEFRQRVETMPGVRYVEEAWTEIAFLGAPNDPLWADQYGPQQVNATSAWELTTGVPNVEICVVDSGVRVSHEDISDDRYFGGRTFSLYHPGRPSNDNLDHGTSVAGVATASTNNGEGIAGLADVGFLSARVGGGVASMREGFPNADVAFIPGIADSIQWCADEGAEVINLSIGGLASETIHDAIEYAWNQGALLVGAAGNDRGRPNSINYPAAWDEVIAVTGTNAAGERCEISSKGPEAELAAPCSNVPAPVSWGRHYVPLPDPSPPHAGTPPLPHDSTYASRTGTSISAPHVSGVAALVLSWAPGLSNQELRHLLQATAQTVEGPDAQNTFGFGIVDAGAALEMAFPPEERQTLVSEDFSSGAPQNLETTGLWHVSSACADAPTPKYLGFHRSDACSYRTEGPSRGSAVFTVDLSGVEGALLEFSHRWETEDWDRYWRWEDKFLEYETGVDLPDREPDVLKVQVREQGAEDWTTLDRWDGLDPNQADWIPYRESLDPFTGDVVEIRFQFDSVDRFRNDDAGWLVDDLRIVGLDGEQSFP